uniref:RNase H type-1 domain-containing protein n=1 Tax=Arion vulgaris TaxID=1028688 RepID=A0A0B7BUJ0_9EUPU
MNASLETTLLDIYTSLTQSTLQALEEQQNQSSEIQSLALVIHNLISSFDINVILQWIPGHTNIPGNDKADHLAKQGSSKPQIDKPVSIQSIKQILKNNSREDWLNRWAMGTTGRDMYAEMNRPNPKDNINLLQRKDQSTIFQLRTGHVGLNYHLHRINPTHLPHCRKCSHSCETVQHILLECPGLHKARQELLPPHPSVHNTLYHSYK